LTKNQHLLTKNQHLLTNIDLKMQRKFLSKRFFLG